MGLYGDRDPLGWLTDQIGKALGTESATDQIIANTVLGVLLLVLSTGLVVTAALLPLVVIWWTFGVLRLIPVFDKYWPLN